MANGKRQQQRQWLMKSLKCMEIANRMCVCVPRGREKLAGKGTEVSEMTSRGARGKWGVRGIKAK